MWKINSILSLLFVIAMVACHSNIPCSDNCIDYGAIQYRGAKLLKNDGVEYDTIYINSIEGDALSSMIGNFFVHRDKICFADDELSTILTYDTLGRHIKNYLSFGRGPKEILGLYYATNYDNDSIMIMDGMWGLYYLDSAFNIVDTKRVSWHLPGEVVDWDSLLKNPDPNVVAMYEYEWTSEHFDYYKGGIIFPVVTEHINYNGFFGKNCRHFYRNASTFGVVRNYSLQQIMIQRSPIYENYKYAPTFYHQIFDVLDNILYFSFEADSLIYCMDLDSREVVKSFGCEAMGIDKDYPEYTSFERCDENWKSDRGQYGYYQNIFAYRLDNNNYLFRSFKKDSKGYGVQLYKNDTLISEIATPKDFKVFGYIAPYFYASSAYKSGVDSMYVHRIKIP